TAVVHAERMKTLYGSAMASAADEREMIDVPQVGEEERGQTNQVPKSLLVRIIQPRLEEIFELVRSRLEQSGFGKLAGRRVVLTGGASQLPGTRELAQLILDKQIRLGRPTRIAGLPEANGGPAFSTAAGLLIHSVRHPTELPVAGHEAVSASGLWGRVGLWLRENL
ncbi:MAG TPA: cell division FtsA domain-containing protein, partial [Azospirillum sp.]|nr:cell division FtsA domain-containing protein [Azospirillum sp.]